MTHYRRIYRLGALSAASLLTLGIAQAAAAQNVAPSTEGQNGAPSTPPPAGSAGQSDIIVTGSRIVGSKITEALPVTVVNQDEIKATGAVSGDELFRSIPQMGDVSFNSTNGQTSSNFARGDVGSIDLRGLGVGNTLS